jgi:hypothetical protein
VNRCQYYASGLEVPACKECLHTKEHPPNETCNLDCGFLHIVPKCSHTSALLILRVRKIAGCFLMALGACLAFLADYKLLAAFGYWDKALLFAGIITLVYVGKCLLEGQR